MSKLYPVDQKLYQVDEEFYPVDQELYPVDEELHPVNQELYPSEVLSGILLYLQTSSSRVDSLVDWNPVK